MKTQSRLGTLLAPLALTAAMAAAFPARADVVVQCPDPTTGHETVKTFQAADRVPHRPFAGSADPGLPDNVHCMFMTASDGFTRMADGVTLYSFGFSHMAADPADPAQAPTVEQAYAGGLLAGKAPAPTLELKEGDRFYLTLANVGFVMRPDLFDPHTVHFHGFPQASSVFDGMPEGSLGVNMSGSFSYFYNLVEPGTYLYHCHQEATEHMEMGMLGNLYVHPKQNGTSITYQGKAYDKFVYNDGDGATGYDVAKALQLATFDREFHTQHINVQGLPFAELHASYPLVNGRGYPDTVETDLANMVVDETVATKPDGSPIVSQTLDSRIVVDKKDQKRLLLRLSNVSVTNYFTLTALGLEMEVVGTGAHILRGPAAADGIVSAAASQERQNFLRTASVTLGGGESADVMIDVSGVPTGTYFLYTTNLNYLVNDEQDFGGMMTEIEVVDTTL